MQTLRSRLVGFAVLLSSTAAAPISASQSAADSPTKLLTAVVLSVSDQSLKVLAREQAVAFVVLRDTKISGKGRPSLLPPAGRRLRLTDALQQGDLVTVTYRESGNRKLAIRIDRVESDR